jgi:hypothetical protein
MTEAHATMTTGGGINSETTTVEERETTDIDVMTAMTEV